VSRFVRAYELMVILDGDLDEPVAQGWIASITDGIMRVGGSVHGKPDWWGKRQFAYLINKKQYGYYVVFNLTAPAGALDELERSFRIADEVVRHKLVRLPDAEASRRGITGAAA
jgi:small subunit ribosomal protein S6